MFEFRVTSFHNLTKFKGFREKKKKRTYKYTLKRVALFSRYLLKRNTDVNKFGKWLHGGPSRSVHVPLNHSITSTRTPNGFL